MPDIDHSPKRMALTLPQLDFWEEFTFHPDQPVSTVAHYIEIEGAVDGEALVRAIRQTIGEAEILSVRFHPGEGDNQPTQSCDPAFAPELSLHDYRGHPEPEAAALAAMEEDLGAKLDLRADRLSAHRLCRIGDNRYFWYIRAHHIIVDGYGLALVDQRCAQLYNHFCRGTEAGLPFHPLARFIEEEDRYQRSPRWESDRRYWNDFFRDAPDIEVLERGDEDYGDEGLHGEIALPAELAEGLRATARAVELGWPDLLTLASGLYIHATRPRETGETADTQILWLPFMSRWGSVGAHLPALLVNILPFRLQVDAAEKLGQLLARSAAELRDQRRHNRFRIEQIARDQDLREGSRYFFSPLINVLPFSSPGFIGCRAHRHILGSGPADGFNLTYRGEEDGSNLILNVDADPALTGAASFARHMEALPRFLAQVLTPGNLDRAVSELTEMAASDPRLDAVS